MSVGDIATAVNAPELKKLIANKKLENRIIGKMSDNRMTDNDGLHPDIVADILMDASRSRFSDRCHCVNFA